MRTFLLTLLVLLLASTAVFAAPSDDSSFEAVLQAEVPELLEHSQDEFSTLQQLGANEPELAFAELEEHTSDELEQEDEMEQDEEFNNNEENEDASMLETESESELESESEAESDRHHKKHHHKKHHKKSHKKKHHHSSTPWHRDDDKQPVARRNAKITCIDGDCVRGTKVAKVKVGVNPTHQKKKPSKLDIALSAVKEEIMVRAKELHLEKDWSKKVAKLIDEYQQKLSKVTGNIAHLRGQTKALLRKKKQIQNVQIQQKLRYKLGLASEDLNRLQKQMEHIAGKENEFSDTEKQLKGTMAQLKNSLLKLRGQEVNKLASEGIH